MPRAEMLERMSSQELSEWMAFYKIEPFGAETQYFGPAITSAVIANVYRGKGEKAHNAGEFMPKLEEKKAQTPNEMIQFAAIQTVALGGKDLRIQEEGEQDRWEQ